MSAILRLCNGFLTEIIQRTIRCKSRFIHPLQVKCALCFTVNHSLLSNRKVPSVLKTKNFDFLKWNYTILQSRNKFTELTYCADLKRMKFKHTKFLFLLLVIVSFLFREQMAVQDNISRHQNKTTCGSLQDVLNLDPTVSLTLFHILPFNFKNHLKLFMGCEKSHFKFKASGHKNYKHKNWYYRILEHTIFLL